jgi:hypothetical protein
MKTCKKCGEAKPHSEYHRHKRFKDGLHANCKVCRNAENTAYRALNPEKSKQSSKKYRDNNKSKMTEIRAAYAKNNPEKVRESKRLYALKNKEELKVKAKAKRLENPERHRRAKQNRRARERAAVGKISAGLIDKLLGLQRGKCACCKLPLGDDYHVDHIMPLALGGVNTDDNIQLLRARCNLQKNAKHPIDFMQERGFLL